MPTYDYYYKRLRPWTLVKPYISNTNHFNFSEDIKLGFVAEAFKTDYRHLNDTLKNFQPEKNGLGAFTLKSEDSNEDTFELETNKILEIFPIYGVDYVRRLLSFYNSSEKVITHILESKI